jgi:hypothetical protein
MSVFFILAIIMTLGCLSNDALVQATVLQVAARQDEIFGNLDGTIAEHDRFVNSWVLNRSRLGRRLILLMRRLIC